MFLSVNLRMQTGLESHPSPSDYDVLAGILQYFRRNDSLHREERRKNQNAK